MWIHKKRFAYITAKCGKGLAWLYSCLLCICNEFIVGKAGRFQSAWLKIVEHHPNPPVSYKQSNSKSCFRKVEVVAQKLPSITFCSVLCTSFPRFSICLLSVGPWALFMRGYWTDSFLLNPSTTLYGGQILDLSTILSYRYIPMLCFSSRQTYTYNHNNHVLNTIF